MYIIYMYIVVKDFYVIKFHSYDILIIATLFNPFAMARSCLRCFHETKCWLRESSHGPGDLCP